MTPEGWARRTIGELVERVTTGVSVNSQGRPRAPGEVGVLKTSAVTYGVFRPEENKAVAPEEIARAREHPRRGCVLFSRMNTIALVGASAFVEADRADLVLPDRIWQLQPAEDVAGRWLHATLSSPGMRSRLSEAASGTSGSMKNLSQEKLLALYVLTPPLREQRKIAAILSSVDDAIETTQAVIDQLGIVKKAMMAELLTRGLPGWHTRFRQTEIGEVPEAWCIVRLSDIVTAGPSNGRSPQARATPPGVPTFSIAAVRDGRVNVRDHLKYVDMDPGEAERFAVRSGDVLIVRGNANPDLVGKCGMVEDPPPGCIYPDLLMRVALDEEMLPALFVTMWNSDIVHDQILDKAQTTNGTYKINGDDVRSTLMPKPPLDEQRVLSDTFGAVDSSAAAHADKLTGLVVLRSALMSVLLTGELRVKPDEEAA